MSGKEILVVNGEHPFRAMISFGLGCAGFAVFEAGDALAARARLADHRPGDRPADPVELQSLGALAALAQRTRLEIFRALVQREPVGVVAGEIARLVESRQNTVSAHLAVLTRADLLTSARHGRNIVYRANLKRMHSLVEYLVANCCQGSGGCGVEKLVALTQCKCTADK